MAIWRWCTYYPCVKASSFHRRFLGLILKSVSSNLNFQCSSRNACNVILTTEWANEILDNQDSDKYKQNKYFDGASKKNQLITKLKFQAVAFSWINSVVILCKLGVFLFLFLFFYELQISIIYSTIPHLFLMVWLHISGQCTGYTCFAQTRFKSTLTWIKFVIAWR